MRSIFQFFKQDDADLDAEFRKSYQDPGTRFLGVATALASWIFGGFCLLDALNGVTTYVGGIQTFRLTVVAILAVCTLVLWTKRDAVAKHYTLLANVIIF